MTKRYYGRGNARRNKPYNSYVTEEEFRLLERLRKNVAMRKGKNPETYPRGNFIMWMVRKCAMELDEGISLEDFCDSTNESLDDVMEQLNMIIKRIAEFKEDAIKVESEEDTDENEG